MPEPALRRERLTTPDDDFIDVDWYGGDSGPLLVVLHGLEGSSRSNYVRGLLVAAGRFGWRGAVLHFRSCSGEPNRARHSYNAGATADLDWFVGQLYRREPRLQLACVGYSLGGNALLKWLGERGEAARLAAAVAVSVPFSLAAGARRLGRGLSRFYQGYLLRSMRAGYRRKFADRGDAPVSFEELARLRDFYRFDDRVTAPLHGYRGADDYYRTASSRQYLRRIARPTLILHALDDPFLSADEVPTAAELGPQVRLELSPCGGHVGFIDGPWPWRAGYWLERRIPAFLCRYLNAVDVSGAETGLLSP